MKKNYWLFQITNVNQFQHPLNLNFIHLISFHLLCFFFLSFDRIIFYFNLQKKK